MLNALSRLSSSACAEVRRMPDATKRRAQLFNARPNWLLRCSVRCLSRGLSPAAFTRTDSSGRPIPRSHALTLMSLSTGGAIERRRTAPLRARVNLTRVVCACTHYLVFKEPARRMTAKGRRPCSRQCTFRLRSRPCLGEPSEVTSRFRLCQPEISTFFKSRNGRAGAIEKDARGISGDNKIC
jgi:hypothetical protein